MRKDRVDKVKGEIVRLSAAIKAWEDINSAYFNPIEQGAIKRASMDLSRALSNLRRSDYT